MAGFPSKGTLGNANSKTSTLTLVLTTTQDADVGDIIVVATAWDNINTGTATGPLDDVLSCGDSANNRYMTGAAAQNPSSGGGQGAHVGIFVAEVTSFLASGSSITVTTQNAARTAKAISAELFGNPDHNHFRIVERTFANDTAVDPSSLTLSSLPTDVPVLLIHALAGEGPQADAYTWDSDYTQFVGDGSTGGAANTNMHLRAGYRELSGSSSDTVDVTSTTADRDYSQVFLGLIGYDVAPYPSTPLLDDFNRANETPLSGGGNWDTTGYGTASAAQLISNAAGNSAAVQNKQSTWAASFSGDVESWATFSADGGGNQRIIAAATTDRGTSTFDNYSLLWGVSPTFCLRLNRVDNSVLTLIGLTAPPVVGWKVGLRVANGYVEVWTNQTDGWRCALVAADATYSGGQIGFGISSASIGGTNRRFDDFGGGGADADLVPPPIGIALETDVAYPFNGANEDATKQGAVADTVAVPGSPGTLTITGLPFQPTWVFIVASDATADDTWQSGTSCMSRGLGGKDTGRVSLPDRVASGVRLDDASGFRLRRGSHNRGRLGPRSHGCEPPRQGHAYGLHRGRLHAQLLGRLRQHEVPLSRRTARGHSRRHLVRDARERDVARSGRVLSGEIVELRVGGDVREAEREAVRGEARKRGLDEEVRTHGSAGRGDLGFM